MNYESKELEKELRRLQKVRGEEKRKKELKTKIWVLKHPKLVSVGEKTREGLGKLSGGLKSSFKKMKEKEEKQRKKKKPQSYAQSYSEQVNSIFK